jgi:hypothetical protein
VNKFVIAATLALAFCAVIRAEDKTKSVEFGKEDKHTITMPDSWKTSEPGGMRALEVAVPKTGDDKEDGEIAVFVMKAAGGVQGNLTRWTGAFGGEAALKDKKEVKAASGKTATVVEVEGTYKGMGKDGQMKEGKENYKLLGAIFEDDGVYIKFTGPKATIEASKAAFNKMVESYK